MKELEGDHQGQGLRVALVAARFNQFISNLLLEGARTGLSTHGVREEDTVVLRVPGAFELPLIAKTLAGSGRYDAVVCLGAVIRGETTTMTWSVAKPLLASHPPHWRPRYLSSSACLPPRTLTKPSTALEARWGTLATMPPSPPSRWRTSCGR